MRLLITVFCLIITCNAFASEYESMDGYSSSPLEDPVFEYAEVIADSIVFNNWLIANYSKLDSKSMKGPKEHLYYLLSSYVSNINKIDGIILPKENDPILETILSWSENLGAYGTHIFYNKIKRPGSKPMPEIMKIPKEFDISAANDMYVVKSKNGNWSTKFPYYFMIGNINDFTASNGMQTQILSVSTGAAEDKTKAGRSQSTLLFVYSPSNDSENFKNYWMNVFDIDRNINAKPIGLNDLKSFYVYDKHAQLHKEFTFLPSTNGSYLVAYLGMDGSYQKNKPHYLDFLSQVNITETAVANMPMQRTAKAEAD